MTTGSSQASWVGCKSSFNAMVTAVACTSVLSGHCRAGVAFHCAANIIVKHTCAWSESKIRALAYSTIAWAAPGLLAILITVACTLPMVIWNGNIDQGMFYGKLHLEFCGQKTNAHPVHSSLQAYVPESKRPMALKVILRFHSVGTIPSY